MTSIIKISKGVEGSKKRRVHAQECWYKNLDLTAETALYYGFTPMETPVITKDDIKKSRAISEQESKTKEGEAPARFSVEEKVAIIRLYTEKKMEHLPQPVMLYFGKPILLEDEGRKTAGKERTVSLEIIGTSKSIAEALLIKTAFEILKEQGVENLFVHINSIGDRDSVARFTRELTAYYRKNIEILPTHCRQIFKKDVFDLMACQNEKCRIIKEDAPKSVSFLSELSREHFKEVLEYLEILQIPYEIDHFLVGNRAFSCQTIFEINNPESRKICKPLGIGIRYGNIGKKLGMKNDLPGVGLRLTFKETNECKNLKYDKPKIYFIQLGFEAKMKSLKIIEILRQAKIPTHQAISRDKLISQLSVAENMKIAYTIIVGQKEALEETAIVRDMSNRSQDTIKICDLPKYLKKL